jgi:hypothetical protein
VADLRVPWERRYTPGQLTPVRVRRGVLALLPILGTPGKPPKPCSGALLGGPRRVAFRVEPKATRHSKRAAEVDGRASQNVL